MAQEQGLTREHITAITILVVIALIVIVTIVSTKKSATTTTSSDTSATSGTTSSTASYKDGTYSASGAYTSPGGDEKVSVKVTIKDGVVENSEVTAQSASFESEEYQNKFIAGYKSEVVGKPVNSIRLSRVSGSSLTSEGFNNALDKIKQQAKS